MILKMIFHTFFHNAYRKSHIEPSKKENYFVFSSFPLLKQHERGFDHSVHITFR